MMAIKEKRTKKEKTEVVKTLTGESFAELFEQSLRTFKEGDVVKGRVVELRRGEALVDIQYKSEGILSFDEFSDPAAVKVGDEVDVMIESIEDENGMVVLSKRKADRARCWDHITQNAKEGSIVEGRIFKKVRGGFMVDIGMEAFLPASLVALKPTRNLDQFVGNVYKFKIASINQKRKNIHKTGKEKNSPIKS
jgi:small subunit ribosomal protein S1